MRWQQLIHPEEQLNIGDYYVLGVYDNHNEEVMPMVFGKLKGIFENDVLIEEADGRVIDVKWNDYFIHVTKIVENGR